MTASNMQQNTAKNKKKVIAPKDRVAVYTAALFFFETKHIAMIGFTKIAGASPIVSHPLP